MARNHCPNEIAEQKANAERADKEQYQIQLHVLTSTGTGRRTDHEIRFWLAACVSVATRQWINHLDEMAE